MSGLNGLTNGQACAHIERQRDRLRDSDVPGRMGGWMDRQADD